jgi:hypothetical protein
MGMCIVLLGVGVVVVLVVLAAVLDTLDSSYYALHCHNENMSPFYITGFVLINAFNFCVAKILMCFAHKKYPYRLVWLACDVVITVPMLVRM